MKLRYTRVFGWYMEVTRAHVGKAPPSWRRKQTVATGERFTCDDLDSLADRLAHAEERASAREALLLGRLVKALAEHAERLRAAAARLAAWDVAAALAEVAHRDDWNSARGGRLAGAAPGARLANPGRRDARGRGCASVPNDIAMGADEGRPRLWLVTGPNMAGKSTLMRQTALAVNLAQLGSFVPARTARIGVVDRVLTRVGASATTCRAERARSWSR